MSFNTELSYKLATFFMKYSVTILHELNFENFRIEKQIKPNQKEVATR